MAGQHTSGPWRVLQPSIGVDANWHVTDESDTFVAHVYGFAHAVDEQSRINATLISAAPDLLAAAETAIAYLRQNIPANPSPEYYVACARLLIAVDKACGQ